MLNANSERELATYTYSDDQDEWYDLVLTCNNCHRKFMTYDFAPNYCPFCGGKFTDAE